MVVENLIHPDDQSLIVRALLLRHRHVNDNSHGSFRFGAKRENSICNSMQVTTETIQHSRLLKTQEAVLKETRKKLSQLVDILG